MHYDDPPEPPTPCVSPAAARANSIVDAFALEALDPASFARIIAGEFYNGGPRATLEDQALAVLSRGYDMSDSTSWHRSLAPLVQPAPTLAAVQETLGQLSELDSSQERLKRRRAYLNQSESSGPGASWGLHVLAQIEVLRFALEWNDLTKAAKRQFHIDQFRDEYSYVDEDNKVIYKWRRRNIEPIVAGRNRLLSLYHLVAIFLSDHRCIYLTVLFTVRRCCPRRSLLEDLLSCQFTHYHPRPHRARAPRAFSRRKNSCRSPLCSPPGQQSCSPACPQSRCRRRRCQLRLWLRQRHST